MFDARTAIAGLYLWLLFGFLSSIVSCDIKKLINQNVYFRHFVGLISFFLLFTITDKNNDNELSISRIWINTFFVYLIFLMMTKSKWYFSIPVLLLLVVDQSYKFQIEFIEKEKKKSSKQINRVNTYEKIRKYTYASIIILIVAGFIHYAARQYSHFGSKFSFTKLLLYSSCNNR
jgi:hypothetical protein